VHYWVTHIICPLLGMWMAFHSSSHLSSVYAHSILSLMNCHSSYVWWWRIRYLVAYGLEVGHAFSATKTNNLRFIILWRVIHQSQYNATKRPCICLYNTYMARMAKLYTPNPKLVIDPEFNNRTLSWSLHEAKVEYLVCPRFPAVCQIRLLRVTWNST